MLVQEDLLLLKILVNYEQKDSFQIFNILNAIQSVETERELMEKIVTMKTHLLVMDAVLNVRLKMGIFAQEVQQIQRIAVLNEKKTSLLMKIRMNAFH